MDFTGKVVLVTGAASGIGRGIAERFSEAGAFVAVVDINGPGLEAVAASLPRAIAITADVARDEDAARAVERTVAGFGHLDVLVNNAGIMLAGTIDKLSPEGWDRLINVNLRAAYLFSHYVIPHMRGRGGAILNISSVHAFVSWPDNPAYDATKAGLLGLTHAMAVDHGRDGIRVNVICPGYIQTPLLEANFNAMPDRERTVRDVVAAHPVGRLGTPRDIAEAALFLCSDAASFITGATLVVDGGMTVVGH
jgi:NAD(P)-dependent dehydrogenase (short-subunit alcohol dehydrogenase family)